MKFVRELWRGLYCYVDGMKFIHHYRLYAYFIIPVLLGVGMYFLGQWFIDLSDNTRATGDNMHEIMISLLKKEAWNVVGYLFTESQKYIAVMLLSPVWAILSESVEEKLTGNKYPFVWKYYIADIIRGIRINIWALLQEYLIFIIYMVVSMIFGFPEWMDLTAALAIGFWYYGFGYMDYVNERRRLNITQSVYFARQHAGMAIGIGVIYSLAFMYIPYGIGLLFAPIAMVGTTIVMHQLVDLSTNAYARKKEINEQESASEESDH